MLKTWVATNRLGRAAPVARAMTKAGHLIFPIHKTLVQAEAPTTPSHPPNLPLANCRGDDCHMPTPTLYLLTRNTRMPSIRT